MYSVHLICVLEVLTSFTILAPTSTLPNSENDSPSRPFSVSVAHLNLAHNKPHRHPTKRSTKQIHSKDYSLVVAVVQSIHSIPFLSFIVKKQANMAKKEHKIKFKKAPGAPRRFKSAYMFFSEHQHKAIRSQMADKKVRRTVTCS